MNNKYIGKNCPFCKYPFSLYDDIVVCSQCDMPHHRDCWIENGACTTFGCLGNIKSVNNATADSVTSEFLDFDITFDSQQSQKSQQNVIYCAKCGASNRSSNSFCINCGSPLGAAANQQSYYSNQQQYSQQYSQQYNPYEQKNYSQNNYQNYNQCNYQNYNQNAFTQNNYANTDLRLDFVGTNQYYYSQKFAEMTTQRKNTSWNWCAFLFTPFWFIYRKMYAWGLGYLGVAFLLWLISSKSGILPLLIYILQFTGYILFGIFSNNIYMKHLDKLVIESTTLSPEARTRFVYEKGSVNLGATLGAVFGYPAVIIIAFILFFV